MAAPSGQNPVFVGGFVIPVGQWSGDWTAILADITTSGTRGTRYQGVITDCSWEISLPHDDVNFVEALGLGVGATIPVIHFRHTQTVADRLELTTVESVNKVSVAKDVVRLVIRGKGGALTNNVAAPDGAVYPTPVLAG